MVGEIVESSQLIQALLEAAKNEDWETVDKELVPQLGKVDSNTAAKELLGYVSDENSNIRDVAATAFAGLRDLDAETESEVAESMMKMALEDDERYPAGRAMSYLLTLKDKPEFQKRIDEVLAEFRQKAQEMNWMEDLKENIPALEEIF